MQSKIKAQHCNLQDLEEKIAALEEELKKVNELFAGTQQELEKTTNKLHKTQQQRDEQTHLVQEHVKCEEQLHSEASEILKTADSTVSDVDGLHSKIDRKKAVENHNRERSQSFQQTINQKLENMEEGVRKFTKTEKEYYTKLNSTIGRHVVFLYTELLPQKI